MEFPPDTYFIFPAEHFETAGPRIIRDYTAEILAQAWPNGRVMDHWQFFLGGNKALEAEVNLAKLVPAAATLPKWRLTFQQWPRDLTIRRNMTTSGWVELLTLLAANEVSVLSVTGANVLNPGVVEALSGLQDKSSNSASCLVNLLTGKRIFRR